MLSKQQCIILQCLCQWRNTIYEKMISKNARFTDHHPTTITMKHCSQTCDFTLTCTLAFKRTLGVSLTIFVDKWVFDPSPKSKDPKRSFPKTCPTVQLKSGRAIAAISLSRKVRTGMCTNANLQTIMHL